MLSLPLRLSRTLLALVISVAVAPVASAAEPTLLEQLRAVAESVDEVTDASLQLVRAEAEYNAQLDLVRDAARELAGVFATAPEAPAKGSTAIIDELLRFEPVQTVAPGETGASLTRLEQLRLKPTLQPLQPLSRLERLLAPPVITLTPKPVLRPLFTIMRDADPDGTSIYDSLRFGR